MITFWYWICLLFLLINIKILVEESYDTIYRVVIDKNKPIQYLYCLNLDEIIINKTKINLIEIRNDFNYHLRWIQKNEKNRNDKPISSKTIEEITNQTNSRDCLIYQNRICFIFNSLSDFDSFYSSIFLLPIIKKIFVFNNETFSFLKLRSPKSSLNQLSVKHKEYPFSSCSKDYSNFKCLNDKIKRIQRLSRYYYRSDDNESIELNYQINQTIIDNELKIIKQCNQIDCNINLFYPADEESGPITLKSFLYIPKLDFYLQLIGLIVLFFNISVYNLIKFISSINLKPIKLKLLRIKFIKLKFKKFKKILTKLEFKRLKVFKYLNKLKRKYLNINNLIISILLIIIICFLTLFSRSIYNFIEERDDPFTKIISANSIELELPIVICLELSAIKKYSNIYNRSLSELEKETDNGLYILLKDIYLEFLNKKIPTKWQLESKLISFRYGRRCFQLNIFINEPKHQTIFSVTKLIIEFNKNKNGDIYILTDNKIFDSNSYKYNPCIKFRKRILERSKLNKMKKCEDYNQVNCESKWNCIDQCTTKGIYKQIKNLTRNDLFIDKNQFTDKEWSNLFIKPNPKENEKIYFKIKKECEDKYSKLKSCTAIKFEYESKINCRLSDKKEIDLDYEVINFEEDKPLIFKLLLNLLNTQSIFFNLNALKLLLVFLFKFKLNSKLIKIFKFFIYLICLTGLILHFYFIFDEIIDGQLIASQFYELINSIQSPDLIFCFDFNHTKLINQNYKLTYQYLDKITADQLREDLIFNRIEYLNSTNSWIKLNNETNFESDNFKITIFYYLNMKCYRIQKNINYNRNQFEFNDKMENDDLVLKIFLNRTHLKNIFFSFFTKTKNKIRFSKIQKLKLKDGNKFNSFKIRHEIINNDKSNLIKNPLSLNDGEDLDDSDRLFQKLFDYFNELNLVTFKLPFKKDNSNLNYELDDNLFIDLYYDLDKKLDRKNLKYKKKYSFNNIETHYSKIIPEFDLEFSLNFIQKVVVITNETSTAKLIINLLNALSLWFNLCIFDLHIYLFLNKIRLAFNYLSELLLKFESILYKKVFNKN